MSGNGAPRCGIRTTWEGACREEGRLARQEIDTNFDGRADVVRSYGPGR